MDECKTLLVGNHQTLAPDLPFLLEQFITERGWAVQVDRIKNRVESVPGFSA